MEYQIVIIEDESELVRGYKRLLNFDKNVEVKEIIYDSSMGSFLPNLESDPQIKRVFLVDINLNKKRKEDKEGLEIIKYVKNRLPESLVIAISAFHPENEAKEIGANYFFRKRPGYQKEDFIKIKEKILTYFNDYSLFFIDASKKLMQETDDLSEVVEFQNEFFQKNTKHKMEFIKMEYDTLLDINMQHQKLKIQVMRALEETLPDDINTKEVHKIKIKELNNKIKTNQLQLKKLDEEINLLKKSKRN